MILQELVKYYERCSANGDPEMAPIGLEWKEISFSIVIDKDGKFLDFEDLRSGDKKPRGRSILVPQDVRRTVNIEPQKLWDNLAYVLGFDDNNPKRLSERHNSFKTQVKEIASKCPEDNSLSSVVKFLNSFNLEELKKHPLWPEVANNTGNITFRLHGEQQFLPEKTSVHRLFTSNTDTGKSKATCLVTGKNAPLAEIHPAIKGVLGAQVSGASIVSFNADAYKSYGKSQGENAPVSNYAAVAYTTALNSMLKRGSRKKLVIGETTLAFWSAPSKEADNAAEFEGLFFDLFDEPRKDNTAYAEAVRNLYKSPQTGAAPICDDNSKFYVVGIGPNAARLSIRFWHASTISEIATNIQQYFNDITIARPPWENFEYPPLTSLLLATALRHERANILPTMPAAIMRAIMDGTPFPTTLAQSVLRRIRAEQNVSYHQAALLKAFLNRNSRSTQSKEEEMTVGLDESNTNIGYNLGRLFAVLEKVQTEALGDINAPIRERYYASASATPVTCFPLLMRLKNHHLAKLSNKGRVVNLEKAIAAIVNNFKDFPAHLSMQNQGRFAVGYYHQRQAFFTKSDGNSDNKNSNDSNEEIKK